MLAELWFCAQLDARHVWYVPSLCSPASRSDWPVFIAVPYDAAAYDFSLSSEGIEDSPLGLLSLIPAMFYTNVDLCMQVFHLRSYLHVRRLIYVHACE
jgi:hypothetical protein